MNPGRMDEAISLPDGRLLDICVSGAASGIPLIVHHGTPGSRVPLRMLERAAHARGLRYVGFSRPGYGGSTRQAGRSVIDIAADAAALLDALGSRTCLIAGWSGGGPHALACAAALDRVMGTLVIAGVAPAGMPELEFTAGMAEENVAEFQQAAAGEATLRPYLEVHQRAELVAADVQQLIAALGGLLPEVDQAALVGDLGADLVAQLQDGLSSGVDGWIDDDLAFTSPWGFAPGDISSPVSLWQGEQDQMVPFAHGQWLAEQIPGVEAHLLAGEGHISTLAMAERMLDELLALP